MTPRRRRYRLPNTGASVLYADENDRVSITMRYKGGTVVEASYSVKGQRVSHVQASVWGARTDARLTDLDVGMLQYQLEAAIQEAKSVLGF